VGLETGVVGVMIADSVSCRVQVGKFFFSDGDVPSVLLSSVLRAVEQSARVEKLLGAGAELRFNEAQRNIRRV